MTSKFAGMTLDYALARNGFGRLALRGATARGPGQAARSNLQRRGKQAGYLLLPVAVAIALIGLIAFLISSESAIEVDMAVAELQTARADYVARAGLQHALRQHAQQGCGPYTDLTNVGFGSDEYDTKLTHDLKPTASYSALTDQDTWIRSDQPSNNYAADTALHIRYETGIVERPLYRYDLSAIPAKAAILSAKAHFYVSKGHPEGPVDIHRVTADWLESDATWDSMGDQIDPMVIASIPAQPTAGWVEVNLTSQVQAWVNGADNYGITLNSTSEGTHGDYGSRESATESYLEIVVGDPPTSPAKLKSTSKTDGGGAASVKRQVDLIQAPAGFLQLQPDDTDGKDAWISGDQTTWNYGAATFLRVRAGGGGHWHSLLEFDLGRLPHGARIMNARLELFRQQNPGENAGSIEVYPVSQSWVEGGSNGGANPGVTFDYRDTALPWNNPGGDYAASPAAGFDVTAASDTWYDVDVTPLVRQWADGQPNHGLILVAGDDSVVAEFASSETSDPALRPKLAITYTCECGTVCVAPRSSGNLLMVIGNSPSSPNAAEIALRDLFESWGYSVSLIQDDDSAGNFAAAVASNDAIFIAATVASGNVGNKLTDAGIGIVNAEGALDDELGFSTTQVVPVPVGDSINISDNSHYITQPFAAAQARIYAAHMGGHAASGTLAPDLQVLADWNGSPGLAVLDTGAALGGGPVGTNAAGRRVLIPFGQDDNHPWSKLDNNGRLLLQRSIEWAMNKKPAGPSGPGLWVSTLGDVSGSGAPGLDAWSGGEAISFEDPNLLFEPGPTNGTFSSKINLDNFAGDADIDAIHYVGNAITVGGGANTVDLQEGDLLLSTAANETLTSSNSLSVGAEDVFVFRPDTAGDYGSGTFTFLLDGSQIGGGETIVAISLVEKDTPVGTLSVPAGAFLFGTTNRRDVQAFLPTGVGAGTTTGAITELVDGPDVNLGSEIRGLDLAEDEYTLGGHTIPRGAILMTLNNDGSSSGDNGVPTDSEDVFYLVMTQAGANSIGDATLLFDGSDVNLDTSNEDLQALTLRPPPGGFPVLPPQLLFVVPSPGSLGAADAAKKTLFESWGYGVNLIDDDAPLSDFVSAGLTNDVVYVSATAAAGSVGSKLFKVGIGVVNGNSGLHDDFGFSTVRYVTSTNAPLNTVASHYITQPFAGGQVTLYTSDQLSGGAVGTLAADLDQIGLWSSGGLSPLGGLVTLESGAMTSIGENTPGRRAQMPWDNLDVSTLSADGLTILRRSLEWAGGASIDLGPIAHWKLDETAGTTAVDSEGGHDGTLSGGSWTVGADGGALKFDGSDDYVDLTSDAELDDVFLGGATVMAWIYLEGWGENAYGRVLDKSSELSGNRDGWMIGTDGGNQSIAFAQGFTGVRGFWRPQNNTVNLNEWVHYAISYDASSDSNDPTIYLNGVAQTSLVEITPSGTIRSDESINLRMGNHAQSTSRTLDGILDDVRIYDRLLGADEIADIYAASAPPVPGYYELHQPWSASTPDNWEVVDLAPFGVPGNAVVEVAVIQQGTSAEGWGGVRAVGSTLERRLLLHEAEAGGVDSVTMHVQADANSRIEHYSDNTGQISFLLLGYWIGAEYVELFDTFTANDDGVWISEDLGSFGVGPNQVAEIVLQNTDTAAERLAGVRAVGSSINRRFDLHEAESGGIDAVSLMVQADGSSRMQVYAEVVADIDYAVVGYWSTPPGSFTELGGTSARSTPTATWGVKDVSALGVPADSITQFVVTNDTTNSERTAGVRAVGSGQGRFVDLQEAESGGSDLVTMHANVDANTEVEWYSESGTSGVFFYPVGAWLLP